MDNQKIESQKAGGKILGEVMAELVNFVKGGIAEIDIENKACELIAEKGGKPGFMMVPGYHFATCISTNDVVVHGIPRNRVLIEGDVVGIDCGVYYKGFHTDMAETIKIRDQRSEIKNEEEIDRFLETGKRALEKAIRQTRVGNRIGHVSKAIQEVVEGAGYSVVRTLVGHGVGRELHEDPEIPGFLNKKIENTPLIKPGMTLAIEVIYNMGTPEVIYKGTDGWTISTADGKISSTFERTVLVTDSDPVVLTPFD